MSKKYAIHPGMVTALDGDRHYISCEQLIRLYGLPLCDCVKWTDDPLGNLRFSQDKYIHLYPRHDGNYRI